MSQIAGDANACVAALTHCRGSAFAQRIDQPHERIEVVHPVRGNQQVDRFGQQRVAELAFSLANFLMDDAVAAGWEVDEAQKAVRSIADIFRARHEANLDTERQISEARKKQAH